MYLQLLLRRAASGWSLSLRYTFILGKLRYSDITRLTYHWVNPEPVHHHAVRVHLAYHVCLPFWH
jgi:hypothetical protein